MSKSNKGGHKKRKQNKALRPHKARSYFAASSETLSFTANTSSADAELYSSLETMRNKCRDAARNNGYARRVRNIIVNQIIGRGVGYQPKVKNRSGNLVKSVNSELDELWRDWTKARYCHTGGELSWRQMERMLMAEVVEAGDVLIRLHPTQFAGSPMPLALEVIEAERVASDHELRLREPSAVQGIERDQYGRPSHYWIHTQHPHQVYYSPTSQPDEIIRVPADQIIHIRLIERWPQSRAAPWLHAALERLHHENEFETAATIASRIGASKVGFLQNPNFPNPNPPADGEGSDGVPEMSVSPGDFTTLPLGYELADWSPEYPHQAYESQIRGSLRAGAAATDVTYEHISQDYSRANYSSIRASFVDNRDHWRALQQWWIETVREPLTEAFVRMAVLSRAASSISTEAYASDPSRFEAARYRTRGWGWIDPPKEVPAYKEAEKAGYITKTQILATSGEGMDLDDYIQERQAELQALDDAGLSTDTTTPEAEPPAPPPQASDEDISDEPAEAGQDEAEQESVIYFEESRHAG